MNCVDIIFSYINRITLKNVFHNIPLLYETSWLQIIIHYLFCYRNLIIQYNNYTRKTNDSDNNYPSGSANPLRFPHLPNNLQKPTNQIQLRQQPPTTQRGAKKRPLPENDRVA